ncbi:MAG: hypothetical protein AAFZ15_09460 [Bacteroidota bacterium]
MKTIEKKNPANKNFDQFEDFIIGFNQQSEVKGGILGTDEVIIQ